MTVIFDRAQNLREEILQEIFLWADFSPKIPGLLQLIFGGDPEFEKKLDEVHLSDLNRKFEVRSALLPFSLEESRDYIEYRLKRGGSSASQVFTPRAMNFIIYHSKGIPRTLNEVCYEALSVGFFGLNEKVDPENVRKATMGRF